MINKWNEEVFDPLIRMIINVCDCFVGPFDLQGRASNICTNPSLHVLSTTDKRTVCLVL